MNIVAIIPARGGSKGIPQKNIIDFCGEPLLAWTIKQAKNSILINDVFVSTDDENIARTAKKYGAKVIVRPTELATDISSSEDALLHALNVIESSGYKVEVVVFLQSTSPLRGKNDINNAVTSFIDNGSDSLFSGTYVDIMLWQLNGPQGPTAFGHDYRNRQRRQDAKKLYHEDGSIYIFKPEILRKCGNRLGGEISMYETKPTWKMHEIDTFEDLELCEYYARKYLIKGKE